jgi:cleavage and polyadenylation specificity factor subunit 2
MIPTSSSTRVLELAIFLDAYWAQHQIKAPLIWVSHVAQKVRDSAKTMIEWCGDNVSKIFETTKETPFDFQ